MRRHAAADTYYKRIKGFNGRHHYTPTLNIAATTSVPSKGMSSLGKWRGTSSHCGNNQLVQTVYPGNQPRALFASIELVVNAFITASLWQLPRHLAFIDRVSLGWAINCPNFNPSRQRGIACVHSEHGSPVSRHLWGVSGSWYTKGTAAHRRVSGYHWSSGSKQLKLPKENKVLCVAKLSFLFLAMSATGNHDSRLWFSRMWNWMRFILIFEYKISYYS